MQSFLTVAIWIIMGGLTAHFAQQRGRDPYIWFAIGLILGIVGLLLVFILPQVGEEEEGGQQEIVQELEHPLFLPKAYKSLDWYYILNDREQVGPVPFEKIQELSSASDEDFYVWCDGMDDWRRVSEVRSMKSGV